jgi:hypothetical protein
MQSTHLALKEAAGLLKLQSSSHDDESGAWCFTIERRSKARRALMGVLPGRAWRTKDARDAEAIRREKSLGT